MNFAYQEVVSRTRGVSIHPRRLYLRLEHGSEPSARPDRAGLATAAHFIDPVDRARGLRVRGRECTLFCLNRSK